MGSGLLYLAGPFGLWAVLRADLACQRRRRCGLVLRCGPTWSATWASMFPARRWSWSSAPAWWFRTGAGVDGGDRDVLRDAGDDGRGRTDRRGRVRTAAGRIALNLEIAWAGEQVNFPVYRLAAYGGSGAGSGLSRPGRAGRFSAGWRGLVSLPIPGVGPRRCRASRPACWFRVSCGRRPAGSCWASASWRSCGRSIVRARAADRARPGAGGHRQRGAGDGGRVSWWPSSPAAWGCARAC